MRRVIFTGFEQRKTGPRSDLLRPSNPVSVEPVLKEQHLVFHENQRGLSFDKLFSPYLVGAKRIIITDPYLRMFHQLRNLMELMETISKLQGSGR